MAKECKEIARINGRIEDLARWMKLNAPECSIEQKHLNEDSQERAYWHFGYLAALKDVMRLLAEVDGTTRKYDRPDSSSLNLPA